MALCAVCPQVAVLPAVAWRGPGARTARRPHAQAEGCGSPKGCRIYSPPCFVFAILFLFNMDERRICNLSNKIRKVLFIVRGRLD